MAHQIEVDEATGTAAAVYGNGQSAWHTLGETVEGALTGDEALTKAHLKDWGVHKVDLTATDITDAGVTTLAVPRNYAVVRTNPFTGQLEVLGVVGERYVPIQNEAHVLFLDALVDESGAKFDTAGSLRKGAGIFVSMKMPDSILIGGQDRVDLNIVALNDHTGKEKFRVLVSPVRVVCANTERAASRNFVSQYAVRHTAGSPLLVADARAALSMTFRYAEQFEAEAERMIQTPMTKRAYGQFVDKLYPRLDKDKATEAQLRVQDERLATFNHLWAGDPTQKAISGTRWGAYNAVTRFEDFHARVRSPLADKQAARAARAVLSGGVAEQTKSKAWALLSV